MRSVWNVARGQRLTKEIKTRKRKSLKAREGSPVD